MLVTTAPNIPTGPVQFTLEHREAIKAARLDLHKLIEPVTGVHPQSDKYKRVLEIIGELEELPGY